MPAGLFARILCPVDFSDLSAQGLRYAAKIARSCGGRITALYADLFMPPPYFTESSMEELQRQLGKAREQAEAHLARFAAAATSSLEGVNIQIEEALPADAIHRAAEANGADLIVMGTHGRSGVNRLMLGSVAERVLRQTRVPVLAVRGAAERVDIRHIVVPVSDSDIARKALQAAAGLASCMGASITVLHVKEDGGSAAIDNLCGWIPAPVRAACEVRELVRHGNVAEQVIAAASDLNADLLVLGAQHRRFADTTVLGANTIRILRHAHAPVMAVF